MCSTLPMLLKEDLISVRATLMTHSSAPEGQERGQQLNASPGFDCPQNTKPGLEQT